MSRMLASVASLEEALMVQQFSVDIIDLKQPAHGALGALAVETVRHIVGALNQKIPVSATVGDLPMDADKVFQAVQAMAATGVDYVKIGFFPDGDTFATVAKLAELIPQFKLIAVLFADAEPDFALLEILKNAGFQGVMLDTRNKKRGSLLEILPLAQLKIFVESAHAHGLLCGLAGSLRYADIAELLPLQADYLGFRGALCQQRQRTASLDPAAIAQIKHALA
jgi:uncharacterized protein (UPF0264 family)